MDAGEDAWEYANHPIAINKFKIDAPMSVHHFCKVSSLFLKNIFIQKALESRGLEGGPRCLCLGGAPKFLFRKSIRDAFDAKHVHPSKAPFGISWKSGPPCLPLRFFLTECNICVSSPIKSPPFPYFSFSSPHQKPPPTILTKTTFCQSLFPKPAKQFLKHLRATCLQAATSTSNQSPFLPLLIGTALYHRSLLKTHTSHKIEYQHQHQLQYGHGLQRLYARRHDIRCQ